MGSPVLPLTLALAAAVADGGGMHRVAFYLVLAAIPAAAGAALAAAGELAEGRPTTVRVACSAAALALLVLSSAVRSNALGSSPPALAVSALVGALGAYAFLALAWIAWTPGTSPSSSRAGT